MYYWSFQRLRKKLSRKYWFPDEVKEFQKFVKVKSKKSGLWGFVDEDGNLVIPCIYTKK